MFEKIIPKVALPHLRLRVPTFFQKNHVVGARPGQLNISASALKPTLRVIRYGADSATDEQDADLEEVLGLSFGEGVTWIDVQGLGDEATLRAIAKRFNIHPLALEDLVDVPQLPKIESYESGVVWVTRMIHFDEKGALDREQLGIFSGDGVVVTFQERPGDVLDPVRQRIHSGKGRIRTSGADYLAYALLDTIVDGYYPVVERISRSLESLDEQVMEAPGPEFLKDVNDTKLLLTMMRRIVRAERDAVSRLVDEPGDHLSKDVAVYLRDVRDHAAQLSEVVDNLKELAVGLLNTYVSMVSYRTNEVMKVLTIMASIFIPLTFVAGIYGMNFEHMPELQKVWAYPAALGLMLTLGLGMLAFFYRAGWIGRRARPARKRPADDAP